MFIDRDNIIDTSILRAADGKYYRVSADGLMSIERADTLLGRWEKISDLTTLHRRMRGYDAYRDDTGVELRGKLIEGPELFRFNGGDVYGLYSDNYQKPGRGYIPVTTTNLSDTTGAAWQLYTSDQYHFGMKRKRHGCIIGITMEEYDRVVRKFGGAGTDGMKSRQPE